MPDVLIIHEVADYPAWKQVFDEAGGIRREAGERSFRVLREAEGLGRVVHLSTWTSHADAQAFFESPRLEEIRRRAGVRSPEFLYLDELDAGEL
jgi:heme-degrading monooxygenase HmoA